MSALNITFQLLLLLGGSYLWMRYFSSIGKLRDSSARPSKPLRTALLSGLGMVMMIVALSGISYRVLELLQLGASGPASKSSDGSRLLIRIVVGSLFSGVTAGLACLLMRIVLSRKERTSRAKARPEYINKEIGSLKSEV
jgi:hypothetical protein